jgi:hypothetical protein
MLVKNHAVYKIFHALQTNGQLVISDKVSRGTSSPWIAAFIDTNTFSVVNSGPQTRTANKALDESDTPKRLIDSLICK